MHERIKITSLYFKIIRECSFSVLNSLKTRWKLGKISTKDIEPL